jgi:flagellar basal-body rod protein FlgG
MRALNIAATGMQAQQLNVEVISNNIANMNTTGYKRQRAEFEDLLYQNLERAGASSSDSGTVVTNGIQIGLGVRAGSVYRIMEQGNLEQTQNPYDLAIQGNGFFHIQMPDGTDAYTRAGSFQLSPTGQLVTPEGYTVAPGITIPQDATSVSIADNGQVEATIPGQSAPQVIGQLELASFFNEAGLQSVGDNRYVETAASGDATTGVPGSDGFGTISQGFLETSNVNAVTEITNLITAQRAYEMNSKVITTADQMLQATTNVQ